MSKDILPDDLLKEALKKAQGMKTAAYDKEIAQEEEHVFSKEYREKMEKLLEEFENKQEDKEEKKNYVVKKKNLKLRILLIAAIVMLMGSMTVLAVEPLREIMYQFVEKLFSDHTHVSFEEINSEIDSERVEIDIQDYPQKVNKVPKGYKLVIEEDSLKDFGLYQFMQIYQDSKGNNLVYQQNAIFEMDENSLSITSDGTEAESISVCNERAFLLTDEEEYRTIIYAKDGFLYMLGGYEKRDELIESLESVFR